MADVRGTRAAVLTDPSTGTQQAGVDASGNLSVILAANTGVDIGDVDVLSLPAIPAGANTIGEITVGAASTAAGDLAKAEDAVHASGDVGVMSLAVRNDTLAALAGTDGDYAPFQVNASGALFIQEGSALDVSAATVTVDLGANNDVTIDASSIVHAEDAVHGSGDAGVMTLAVRNDALAALAGTDGDYAPLQVDASGSLYVTGGGGGTEYTEDEVAANPIIGTATMMERDDALGTLTPAEADWAAMRCSAEGALWVQDFNSDGILADTATIAGDTTSLDGKVTACDTGAVVISSGTVTTVSTVTNLAQLGGTAISMNTGVRDAGTQRVTIATDDSVPTVPGGPTNPGIDITNITTPVSIAAGSTSPLKTADLVTKKLHQAHVAGSAPFKVVFQTLANSVATDVGIAFGDAFHSVVWEPPHPDFVVSGSGAGDDGFQANITNLDPNDTTDFYAAFYYAD